uniref:peptidylprolyl isomerase n=1 Tax=Alexandrium monilatum TaxID=311494 RepID=A0A7S4RMF4_9DINO|mmetsp:Transcript_104669/g.312639  ORF Transcript_104669/g.312639 Transcript_104669/m.312639 type:complete len:166 (-) Transcript_104669:121-618(-)
MALRFYRITVPISIVLATCYVYYITRKQAGKRSGGNKSRNKQQHFNDVDIVTHHRPSTCSVQARRGDLLQIHYSGYSKKTGKMFATSRNQSEPYVFKLGTCNEREKPECIKGFDRGLAGVCAGEKRKVTIPPRMAFGTEGRPPDIQPNDFIVFNIECIDVDSFGE